MSNINLEFQINVYNFEINDPKREPFINSYCFGEEIDNKTKFIDLISSLTKEYGKKEDSYFYIVNDKELFWGQFFGDEIYGYLDYDINLDPQKYNIRLDKLDKQFNISNKLIEFNVNGPGIGGDVGRENGIHFFFHTNEKDIHAGTPHIHVKKGGVEYRVNLNTKKPMDKTFKNRNDNKTVNKFIDKNREQLIDYWNKVVINGESLKIKFTI